MPTAVIIGSIPDREEDIIATPIANIASMGITGIKVIAPIANIGSAIPSVNKPAANPIKPPTLTLFDKSISDWVKAGITVVIASAIEDIMVEIAVPTAVIIGSIADREEDIIDNPIANIASIGMTGIRNIAPIANTGSAIPSVNRPAANPSKPITLILFDKSISD